MFSPINENNYAVIKPLKRLMGGSIVAGLLITSNILPLKTQVISIPPLIKITALAVTILGALAALELADLASKQHKPAPETRPHHFSNILGFFPSIIHRTTPKLNLALGQSLASQLLDQT